MVIDLGSISTRSQSDIGSRVDLGSISGRPQSDLGSRIDLGSISVDRDQNYHFTSSSSGLPVKFNSRLSLLRRERAGASARSPYTSLHTCTVHRLLLLRTTVPLNTGRGQTLPMCTDYIYISILDDDSATVQCTTGTAAQ